MNETSKCVSMRKARGDFDAFLRGVGIDIGCGPDPLAVERGTVRHWDLADGDAQLMLGVANESYQFVYSSHCLEHMRSVGESLKNWSRIIKPGGFLYVVVPDYVLYEKMIWPSVFNPDHKHSFCDSLTRQQVRRENHWNLTEDLLPALTAAALETIRITFEDAGYNYNAGNVDQTRGNALAQFCIVARKSQ